MATSCDDVAMKLTLIPFIIDFSHIRFNVRDGHDYCITKVIILTSGIVFMATSCGDVAMNLTLTPFIIDFSHSRFNVRNGHDY